MTTIRRSFTSCRFLPDALSHPADFSRTLLQGALIAGLLAIIAGIFGMHVMSPSHATHGHHAAAVTLDHVHHEALPAAAGHEAAGHSDHSVAAAPDVDVSSCEGTCHNMQESGAACIPSAKTGSLSVFPPHETGDSFRSGPDTLSSPAPAYAYTPPSPTPCELSISRT